MLYLTAFLLLCAYIFAQNYIERGRQINTLESENNALKANVTFMEKKLEKEHADTLAISERNKELEEAVKQDKSFDWNADISNSPVIKQLQAN